MSGYQQQPPPPQYGQPQLGFQQPQPGFQQPQPGFQQGYPPQPYGQPYAAGSSSYGSAQPLPQQQQPYGYDSAAKPAFAAPQTVTGLPAEAAGPHFDFTNAPRWPDLWATLLFLANLTAYIALSVSGFIYGQSSGLFDEPASDGDSTTTPSLSKEAVDYLYGVGATSIGVALIASFIYFLLMQR